MKRSVWIAVAAALCSGLPLAPAFAQGALKPVDALVVNPPSRPVPVAIVSAPAQAGEGSREAYSQRVVVPFGGGAGSCTSSLTPFAVPSGKRLVLTHLAGVASLPAPSALTYVSVGLIVAGEGAGPLITVPAAAPLVSSSVFGTRNISSAGQQVQAYIDGAFYLCVGASSSNDDSVTMSLHGYYVAKP
jgi:hypothetical protein